MSFRSHTFCFLGIALLLFSAGVFASSAQVTTFRPNIILIVADDLGQQTVSAFQKRYSEPVVRTLHCDRIATEGMLFTQAYSTSSVGGPSRFGILTGTYPWRRGILSTPAPDQTYMLATNEITLPFLLQNSGYKTGYIGKWGLGLQSGEKVDWNKSLSPGPNDAGFDYFFGFAASHDQAPHVWIKNQQIVGKHPGEKLTITEEGETKGISLTRNKDQISPTLAKEAQRFIADNRDEPFFLYFAPTALRPPAHAAPFLKGNSGKGEFGDYLLDLDWQVGRLITEINKQNLAHRTIFVFTSDNGGVASMGVESGIQTNGSMRGSKGDIHEGGVRVPFMIKWDHRIPRTEVNTNLISTVDIMATLCAAANVEIPEGAAPDSRNFLSEFYFATVKSVPRTTVITASNGGNEFAIRKAGWKLVQSNGIPGLKIKWPESVPPVPKLHDLDTDTGESLDMAEFNQELVQELQSELESQLAMTTTAFIFNTNQPPPFKLPAVLVEPAWLHSHLKDPRIQIIDARTEEEYLKGHIPGAISLPRKSTYHSDEGLSTMRAPIAKLEKLFSEKGIRNDAHLVIYDNKNFRDAARLFWLMELCGHSQAGVLNHGLTGWTEREYKTTQSITTFPVSSFTCTPVPHLNPKGPDVFYAKYDRRVTILDTRSREEWEGWKSITAKKGNIPSSISIPFENNLSTSDDQCSIADLNQLKKVYGDIPGHHRVITYCNTGTRASVSYLALRALGYDAAVYDGSWTEWSQTPKVPIEQFHGPFLEEDMKKRFDKNTDSKE